MLSDMDIIYVRNKFRDYYKIHPVTANDIIDIEKREIGIGDYGKKISARHLSFSSLSSFNNYLASNTPFYVSYSLGYYNHPDRRPMENKELLGADIVYEFDADDFDTTCKHDHTIWYCKNHQCLSSGKGYQDKCPECHGQVEIFEWVCDECLDVAKKETLRLMDVLESDFKLDPSTFIISFSGSKGYHVRITDPKIKTLSKSARLQLMNYVLGNDINLSSLGFNFDKETKQWFCPSPDFAKGWGKKIIDYIIFSISDLSESQLSERFDITRLKAKRLIENKELILNKMHHNILWSNFNSAGKLWKQIIDKAVSSVRLKIDPSSSGDIYKIMRVPNTIHGGTGFLSSRLEGIDSLKSFDPLKDPVVLSSNEIRKIVITRPTPKFRLADDYYGPFAQGDVIEIPEQVKIYLMLKDVAR